MLRLLRWGTFLVLILVILGAALSYPTLRDRFFSPMLAAAPSSIEVLSNVKAASESLAVAQATTQLSNTATDTVTSTVTNSVTMTVPSTVAATATVRPTVAPAQANTRVPAVIIEGPAPTITQPVSTQTPISSSVATPTVFAIATTSLLPASDTATPTPTITPTVAITTTPTATRIITASVGIAVEVTPTPSITAPPSQGKPAAVGEKGYEAPLPMPPLETQMVGAAIVPSGTNTSMMTVTPIIVVPSIVTPIVVTTVEISSSTGSVTVTPIVVTTIDLTPFNTPIPLGPTARADSPLYSGPDFNAPTVGQVSIGEQLLIVGWYTEGTWYLLATGLWLPGVVVDNPPPMLPLVVPTITPVPTNTPTITPTPLPTATLVGSATPSPTPTSLDAPVCDCSADNLDCLGNIFANRAQAQQCFEYCFRQTGLDIHLLDPNLNGVACENLP